MEDNRKDNKVIKILIWGLGHYFKVWRKWLPSQYKIVGFISSDFSLKGTVFEGKKVYMPYEILKVEYEKIVIASSYKEEILKSISEQGIDLNKVEILQFEKDKYFPSLDVNRKKIKTYYAYNENVGDLLNSFVQDVLFSVNTEWEDVNTAEMMSIGSVFERLLRYEKADTTGDKIRIWGTGFMNFPNADYVEFKRKIDVVAVRGRLTLEIIKDILGCDNIDCAIGDPGLLVSKIIETPPKKYELGIIPHYQEIENPIFKEMSNKSMNVKMINMRENPLKVIKDIASCETILSNSLHGLIIADSFCIPNRWVRIGKQTRGNVLFKYYDYYSSYQGIDEAPISVSEALNIKTSEIEERYKITPDMVLGKQQELIDSWR